MIVSPPSHRRRSGALARVLSAAPGLLCLLLGGAACSIDFNAAVPCETDQQCPANMACNTAIGRCQSGAVSVEDAGDAGDADTAEDLDATEEVISDVAQDEGTGDAADVVEEADAVVDVPGEAGDVQEDAVEEVDACATTPEVCNGLDDNCNDQVDEGLNCGSCPDADNMALIVRAAPSTTFCIDIYEASRPDASLASVGDTSADPTNAATSKRAVQPWTGYTTDAGITAAEAETACEAAGKRLCTADEWTEACGGPLGWDYPYDATTFNASACNGAETPGGSMSVGPTGSRPNCVSPESPVDMSGNVAEWASDGTTHGGSYGDTSANMSCTGAGQTPDPVDAHVGFRCCADAIPPE